MSAVFLLAMAVIARRREVRKRRARRLAAYRASVISIEGRIRRPGPTETGTARRAARR